MPSTAHAQPTDQTLCPTLFKYKPSHLLPLLVLSSISLSACQQSPNHVAEVQTAINTDAASTTVASSVAPTPKPNVSQQFIGANLVQQRLKMALPEITYSTDDLPIFAKQVNQVSWPIASDAEQLGDFKTSTTSAVAVMASAPVASAPDSTASKSATNFQSTIDYSALKPSVQNNQQIKNQGTLKPIAIQPNEGIVLKTQALLNWHGHSVGPVTGVMNKNTIKALQIFQQKHNLPMTTTMNDATWAALTSNQTLNQQPVLVNYQLTAKDLKTTKAPKDMQYKTAREAVAEKFHMSQKLLGRFNPNTPLKAGNVITVYNPYQPNMTEVTKVVTDKKKNILYAYAANGELVASYPTTVGSNYTPSPSGTLKVKNRVLNPTYNTDFSSKEKWLPPGPNNPVGPVWIGLSKRGFGIHGSPEPELISAQKSHGCVRLTNWDALSLYGTIADGAEVVFQ